MRAESWFDAHEALEDEWRDAPEPERDFLQGLVHVTVAWHHAGNGNRPGAERQLEKAARRLAPYAPTHRGVDVTAVLGQVEAASARVTEGLLDLLPVRL
jgi:predicted metal-dependent hydrolase